MKSCYFLFLSTSILQFVWNLSGFWYKICSFLWTFFSEKQLDILTTTAVTRDIESQTQELTYIDLVLINYFVMSTTGEIQNVSKTMKYQNLSTNISDIDTFCRKSNASNLQKSNFQTS